MYHYHAEAPTSEQVAQDYDWVLLNFGTNWCGHCQAAQSTVAEFLTEHPVAHIAVEDGKGRRLGREFKVKLWPTLILLHQGQEVARVVRPTRQEDVAPLLQALSN